MSETRLATDAMVWMQVLVGICVLVSEI